MTPTQPGVPAFSPSVTPLDVDGRMERVVVDGTMAMARGGAWILKNKGGWQIETRAVPDSGTAFDILSATPGSGLYVRTVVELDAATDLTLVVEARGALDTDRSCTLTAGIYADPELVNELVVCSGKLVGSRPTRLRQQLPRDGRLFLLLQINFPAEPCTIDGFELSVGLEDSSAVFEPKSFSIHCCGSPEQAGSRLRGWKLAAALERAGHTATVDTPGRSEVPAQADVLVFQKVRPFDTLGKITDREKRFLVLDLDDNHSFDDRGDADELVSFINHMDVVTVRSEHLREIAARFHPNVVVVDDPPDIDSTDLCKAAGSWSDNIGWFGAPETLPQLSSVDGELGITTVTRGGDVEYDRRTIDRTITGFDLLLFPLSIDECSAAETAERMIKAAALGVPLLASATAEHERAAARIGMPDAYLVREGERWADKVAAIRESYERVSAEFLGIRARTLATYDAAAFARQMFDAAFAAGKRRGPGERVTKDARLADVDLLVTSLLDPQHDFERFAMRSEIPLEQFARTVIFDPRITENEKLSYAGRFDVVSEDNPLETYERLDEHVAGTSATHVLLANDCTTLMRPLTEVLALEHDVLGLTTTAFGTSRSDVPRHHLEAYRVLRERIHPELLLVRTDWLRNSGILAAEMLSFFPLAIWMEALICNDTSFSLGRHPIGLRHHPIEPANVSRQFARARIERDPAMEPNLPDDTNQWCRVSHDIVHTILERHPEFSSAVAAKLLQHHYAEVARRGRA